MLGEKIRYYTDGNTAKGFKSLLHSNLTDVDCLYVLKDPLGVEASEIINEIAKIFIEKGHTIEFMHTPQNNDSLRGIKIPDSHIAVVDGNGFDGFENKQINYFNLNEFISKEEIQDAKNYIARLEKEIESLKAFAYSAFAQALKIHDEWEDIYISNMNFDKANDISKNVISEMLKTAKDGKTQVTFRRFLGASTPYGSRDFIQSLTEGLGKRYFIKGRPGSGKSTMLRAILAEVEGKNINAEVYHCGFDPDSLDMIILRQEGIAIFDSTAPHEYFPEKEGDLVIDMYSGTIEVGTDEKFTEKIKEISARYKEKIDEGYSFLLRARKEMDILEKIYRDATIVDLRNEFIEKIKTDIKNSLR